MSFAATASTEIFLDETNRTELIKFLGDKMLTLEVDKVAVKIALEMVEVMPMQSFKIPDGVRVGKAADLLRRNNEIADAFREENIDQITMVEGMPNGTAPERLEIQKNNVEIAELKKKFVVHLGKSFDIIGLMLKRYVSAGLAAMLNAETNGLWDVESGEHASC